MEVAAANLAVLIAATVQVATGVGFAMLAVPVLALIGLAWVPAPMLVANIALSLMLLARTRTALVPREAPPIVVGLVLGTALGAGVLALLPREALGLAIGLVIVLAVAASLATPSLALTRGRLLLGAVAGGASGAIAGMHGPPLILLYQHEPPEKVRATMAGVFIFGSLLALGALSSAGLAGAEEFRRGLLLLPGTALGFAVGRAIGRRLPPALVRLAMLAIAGAAGVLLIARSL